MRHAIFAGLAVAAIMCSIPALGQLDRITDRDAGAGLRAALEKGAQAAVANLGRPDGFLGNAAVKIPLPPSLQRAESMMRRVGVDAVKKMSVQDAKGILTGGETSATDYFRRTTSMALHGRFLPIVRKSTERVGVAQKYNQYAEQGVAFGLVKNEDANLDEYVTQKALDRLYLMIAEEEKKIRKDPVQAGSAIVKKVFGAVMGSTR